MVIIFISSRRAVLRRFAALCIASQCNSTICLLHRVAALRVAALGSASPRRATQGNSTICFSLRSTALRSALQHVSPLCCATLLNDLFVTTQRTPQLGSRHLNDWQRDFAYCDAPLRSSTQRFVCYIASRLCSPCRNSVRLTAVQRNDLFVITQRTTAPRRAPRLDTTLGNDLFVITQRFASLRTLGQRNSTICLLRRSLTLRTATRVTATQRNHLFVTTQLNAAQCNSSGLDAPRLNSTQRFVYYSAAAPRCARHRIFPQRTETLTRKTNVQTFETNFGNV
jgi:hypothetical protein